jgi:hypothetical protein
MEEIKLLREYIRNTLRHLKKSQREEFKKQKLEEQELRSFVRKIIKEAEDTTTHDSTGINVLADLLDTVVPILRSFYAKLKTDDNQRKSFRAHIIKSVQNMLSPIATMYRADTAKKDGIEGKIKSPPVKSAEAPDDVNVSLSEADEEIDVKVKGPETDPNFIPTSDIKKDQQDQQKQAEPKPEDAFVAIPTEDETGRNIALQAFKRVEKQIREAYSLLANETDRDLFYDYLITNLKLYFDKFEDESQSTVPEPTTSEYEAEKARKDASLQPQNDVEPQGDIAPEAGLELPEEEPEV